MINSLINYISAKSIQGFVRSKNSSFRDMKEDLSEFTPNGSKFFLLYKLGEIEYDNLDTLLVFSCEFVGELSSRSSKKMQFEIAKKVLKEDFKDGAVFVFYDKVGKFRFSFIRRNYGDKEHKYSNWRRYTYFVDPLSQTNRTFKERIGDCRFDSLENIQEAFSVEPLSDEFFDGYKVQYEKFCNYMQNNKQMRINFASFLVDGTDKAIRDYVKKMLGRIVFLHFLQKKGWMGVSKESKSWIGGDQNFLQNLFLNCSKEQKDNFLDEVLEPMFFKSLNKPRENDLYDTKTSLGTVKIPYLNGGLFDKDKLDEPDSKFPASYFKELFDFFNQYNFTIDENDPNDEEVGVDPEMLGRIFENLLEDNKDKGAYYTPKEIVHFMCQESLKEYLSSYLSLKKDKEIDYIIKLIRHHDIDSGLSSRLDEINNAINIVKICDPAIGSGAFPMGLLKEIFTVKQTLWLYEHGNIDRFPASEVKLNIIQNSIYGVDIEKGAVDIARLRFWLSLVVDRESPEALPNLDYKIMCGDSIINRFDLDSSINDVFIEYNKANNKKFSLEDYKKLVSEYTNAHESKEQFRTVIEDIKSAFKSVLLNIDITKRKKKESIVLEYEAVNIFGRRKADIDKVGYEKAKNELLYLLKTEKEIIDNKFFQKSFEWRFEFPSLLDDVGNFKGFDIVIGNPPYVSAVTMARDERTKMYFKDKFPTAKGSYDLYLLFLLQGVKMACLNGIYTWIIPNKFLIADYAKNSKIKLIEEYGLAYSINVSKFNAFEGIGVYPIIILGRKNNNHPYEEFILNQYKDLTLRQFTKTIPLRTHKTLKDFGIKINSGATGFQAQQLSENISYYERKDSIPFCVSGNIDRYKWSNKSVRYMGEKYETAFIHNNVPIVAPTKWSFWTKPKIVIAGMTKVIEAVYVECPLGLGVGIYGIYDFGGIDPYCLTAVLNSKYLTHYFLIRFKDKHLAGGYLAINKSTIEEFPLVKISTNNQNRLAELSKSCHRLVIDGKSIEHIENEIDTLVYKLYGIPFEEIIEIDPTFYMAKSEYEAFILN